MPREPLKVELHPIREEDQGVILPRIDVDARHLVGGLHHPFGAEKSRRQLRVVSRRAHENGHRVPIHHQLQRLLDRHPVRAAGRALPAQPLDLELPVRAHAATIGWTERLGKFPPPGSKKVPGRVSSRMMRKSLLPLSLVILALPTAADPERDAETYIAAVEKINAAHAKKPGTTTEEELHKKLPFDDVKALARLLKEKPSDEIASLLFKCGEAALDLAQLDHFQRIRSRLLEIAPAIAAQLGDAAARDRFLVRTIGEFADEYSEHFANITDAILDAYDEVFGFKEWSKVPGKKIRIRVNLEERITRPPHFAPQFPYHSEIDMPVLNAKELRSPTPQGHMMFYGLCHELGHLIAMWGDRRTMEDHHAWAHYTGVAIVEHMAGAEKYRDITTNLRDVRWRSLKAERAREENQVDPSTRDKAGVMAFLLELHEVAGPRAIGAALNHMDENDAGHRINHVRYYSFADLEKALAAVVEDRDKRKEISAVFP